MPRTDPTFLELVTERARGKLKIYIGSAAGVGKTYRMLNEAHDLRRRGIDVVIGFVEPHKRTETIAQIGDLEIIPRKRILYRNVTLEEMDLDAILARHPSVAIVDELAHTNVPGSRHGKRWEDVQDLLEHGINVITALNVQHLESLNDIIRETLGVTVRETVPDWVVMEADQVVNMDISAEDLRQRLTDGKIYAAEKVVAALNNFFTNENLTTLRELALREVASNVDHRREAEQAAAARDDGWSALSTAGSPAGRILVAMSSNPPYTQLLLRRASRIAGRLNTDWYCVYVQTPRERADRIDAAVQRQLVDNIQRAQMMGAEIVKLEGEDIAATLCEFALRQGVSLLIVGQSQQSRWRQLTRGSVIDRLVNNNFGLTVMVVGRPQTAAAGEKTHGS
jgi:two-component system sensor histidine kinase KdpD